MFKFIDRFVEKILIRHLHKKKPKYINQAFQKFKDCHPEATQEMLDDLYEKLMVESDRVYDIVDKSVLRAGIIRAKWTFWITAVTTSIIIGALIALTDGFILPIIVPVLTSIISWILNMATIPINYNERVKGGMDAVVHAFEVALENDIDKQVSINEDKIKDLSTQVGNLSTKFCSMLTTLDNVETIERKFKTFVQEHQPQLGQSRDQLRNVLFPQLNLEKNNEDITTTKSLLENLNAQVDIINHKVDKIYALLKQQRFEAAQDRIFNGESPSRLFSKTSVNRVEHNEKRTQSSRIR